MAYFDYVNPDAPKGGIARVAGIGTFNNLNPFVDKGILAQYINPQIFSITHERLMMQSDDELATYYGRLAETIEVADDYTWVAYTLRKNAYWHDGVPVTMDDVSGPSMHTKIKRPSVGEAPFGTLSGWSRPEPGPLSSTLPNPRKKPAS